LSQIELPPLLGDNKLISSNANPKACLIKVPNVVTVNQKLDAINQSSLSIPKLVNHILGQSKPVLQVPVGFCPVTPQIGDFFDVLRCNAMERVMTQ